MESGDRIVVKVEKSVSNLALYLASLQRGAVYVPLNTGYRPQEVEYFLRDTGARLVVCDPADTEVIGPVASEISARLLTLDAAGLPSSSGRSAWRVSISGGEKAIRASCWDRPSRAWTSCMMVQALSLIHI